MSTNNQPAASKLKEIINRNNFLGAEEMNKFFNNFSHDNLNIDGSIELRLSQDKMQAHLIIKQPVGQGRKVTADEVLIKLKDSGVVYGLDLPKILSSVENPNGLEFLAAKGLEPENGKDAEVVYFFELEPKVVPVDDSNEQADYYNLNLIQTVRSGEILAHKKPATEGRPGQNILGVILKPKRGKDIPLIPGKNTELIDNDLVLVATCDGQIIKQGNKISIDPVLIIKGDVNYNTGNIEFVGPIIIKGTVQPGFRVVAEGDLEIAGNVHDAQIISTGNINIKKGIIGQKCHVECTESIYTAFVNHAYVKAGENLVILNESVNGKIKAGRSINISGRNGAIKGGLCQAGDLIEAEIFGGPLTAHTRLEVGVSPNIFEEYKNLCDAHENNQEELAKAKKAINYIKSKGLIDNDMKAKLIKLNRGLQAFEQEEKEIEQGKEQLEIMLKSAQGMIKARKSCYEGVTLVIGNLVHDVINKENRVFYKRGSEGIVKGFL